MEFIDLSYFTKGMRKVDNASAVSRLQAVSQAANNVIEGYIEVNQNKFLRKVFGDDCLGYITYLSQEDKDVHREEVLDQLRDAYADYVMFDFLRNQQTSSSTVGEKKLKSVNDAASSVQRQCRLWNDMVDLLLMFKAWAASNNVTALISDDLLTKINRYGI